MKDKSFAFAVRVVKLARWLETEKREYILSKQILHSGTAIGALISEADFAQSKADFISKMSISLKEANETGYWLELLNKTNSLQKTDFDRLDKLCTEIRVVLIKSINTAKENK